MTFNFLVAKLGGEITHQVGVIGRKELLDKGRKDRICAEDFLVNSSPLLTLSTFAKREKIGTNVFRQSEFFSAKH